MTNQDLKNIQSAFIKELLNFERGNLCKKSADRFLLRLFSPFSETKKLPHVRF